MRLEDIRKGQQVRISDHHPSGYGGREGMVVAVGEAKSLDKKSVIKGATVDIGEVLLVLIEAEALDKVDKEKLPPGWEEFDL